MSSRCWAIVMCTLMALVGTVAAPARAGVTTRVSVASDGTQGNGNSEYPSISADGRYVVFQSDASNLAPPDTNGTDDIFVHDRHTGETVRVSVASDGTQAIGDSSTGFLSADGRYVGFTSYASNLVPDDTNQGYDVFVHDRVIGETTRVSVASDGTEANSWSWNGFVSADGRYVGFESYASNVVPDDTNGTWDVFVHDRQTGETVRVSVASDGTEANSDSNEGSISADGRYVGFESYASNLVPGDTNGWQDVFVHDRLTGQNTRVSVASDGTQATGGNSYYPSISADGRYVAFSSEASNLVPDDTNAERDIFVHDRQTGETVRVSVASDGTEANSWSWRGFLSADGRYVGFDSEASNLVPNDTNGRHDVFVHDRQTGATVRVSVASDGTEARNISRHGFVSADGRYVAFWSAAWNLVPDDTNARYDVFVHDRWPSQCLTLAGNCWHMVTLPCHPTDPDPWEVFDELRPPTTALDLLSGCLHRYDPGIGGYVGYDHSAPEEFGHMVAGAGYWLWVFDTVTICYQAECSGGSESVHFATAGWHMMGSPQLVDTHLDDTLWYHAAAGPYPFSTVTDPGGLLWVADPLYYWSVSDGGYGPCGLKPEEDDHLRIFRGHWLYTYVDDLTVEIPLP